MSPSPPMNHAVAARNQRLMAAAKTHSPPEVSEELLVFLEATFPPRCYTGADKETLEEHLAYAGKVDLISYLREAFELGRPMDIEEEEPR